MGLRYKELESTRTELMFDPSLQTSGCAQLVAREGVPLNEKTICSLHLANRIQTSKRPTCNRAEAAS
jgi:hypothetical protein